MTDDRLLIDDILPTWHWRTRHARHVASDPARAFATGQEITLQDVPALRSARRFGGGDPSDDQTIFGDLLDHGFTVLELDAGRELVLGRITGVDIALDRHSFDDVGGRGVVKTAVGFSCRPDDARTLAVAEVRMVGTDNAALRRIRRGRLFGRWPYRAATSQFIAALARRVGGPA